ncbi:hypothetical protein B0T13DRAFT_124934 [Neurospora crassa]|nr:hypothetical protein B0T13DRAFT_124934 [Neurospora crassa]
MGGIWMLRESCPYISGAHDDRRTVRYLKGQETAKWERFATNHLGQLNVMPEFEFDERKEGRPKEGTQLKTIHLSSVRVGIAEGRGGTTCSPTSMRALLARDILQLSQLRNYTSHLVRLGTTHHEKCSLLPHLPRFEVDESDFRVIAAPLQSMCPIQSILDDVGHHKDFTSGKEQYADKKVHKFGWIFQSQRNLDGQVLSQTEMAVEEGTSFLMVSHGPVPALPSLKSPELLP